MSTIRQKILSVIQESPGIHADEVRARLPELTLSQTIHALQEMMTCGRIESSGYLRYRAQSRGSRRKPVLARPHHCRS